MVADNVGLEMPVEIRLGPRSRYSRELFQN
jgi:hypothetical protein